MENISRAADAVGGMPAQKKVMLFAIIGGVILGMTMLVNWARTPEFSVLFANLEQDDVQLVVGKLKEKKVEYKLAGSAVMVPDNQVYELRMELAGEGIPKGGGVGFEIFDKSSLGMTEFVQKLNYKRALQGELARTVRQLSEVEDCRVHLVIPERTLFVNNQERSRASVVLKLRSGMSLSQEQSMGIVHLVASAVEGLSPNDITVVDTKGRVLSKPADEDGIGMLSSTQLEYKRAVEKDLESRVQSMLETVLGAGKAVVRVTADMDFTRQELSEERYDPQASVIRSQQKSNEKEQNGKYESAGIPGVASNIPGKDGQFQQQAKNGNGPSSERQSETSNYEISMSKTHTVKPTGQVRTLSAAILIDGTYKEKEKGKSVFVPRPQEEMAKLTGIVQSALGYNQTRGDKVEVVNVPFETAIAGDMSGEAASQDTWVDKYLMPYLKYGIVGIGMLLMIVLVLRPMVNSLASSMPLRTAAVYADESEAVVPALEAGKQKMISGSPVFINKENVGNIVSQDPARAAGVVKGWLREK
ncbi:MAG TPA: flagellar basal-body MS-ring/collar protein FliF [Nitrospirota bacterium]